MNNIILVLGAWGSGTTAVTGILDHLGAYTCPPHINTNDPKTICSYEPAALRSILLRYVDELGLCVRGRQDYLIAELQQWVKFILENEAADDQAVVLKHPLLSIILSDLLDKFRPRIICVKRPYEDIERSRIRRNWPPAYGILGARRIYECIEVSLNNRNVDILDVSYPDLLTEPDRCITKLAEFSGLGDDDARFLRARTFLRV